MERRLDQQRQVTLVNVLGAGGSGTTILALMLGNSPEGFACGETRVWYRPYQPTHFNLSCWCGQRPCPLWETVGGFPEHGIHARIAKRTGATLIADSSKWFDWMRDASGWARGRGMRVRNAVIWREPLDLVHTWWRRGRLGQVKGGYPPAGKVLAERATAFLAQRFCHYYDTLLAGDEAETAVVSYDRLIDDPAGTLSGLFETIGAPYREGQERFWEGEHHTLFGNEAARATLLDRSPRLERPARAEQFEAAAAELAGRLPALEEVGRTRERLHAASLG
jgi:hypothetical protein